MMSGLSETIYKDIDKGNNEDEQNAVMSEKVQILARGIYREFEKMIKRYDSTVLKDLMPLVVSVLESLDELEKLKRSNDIELQLLKEDNSALMNQYDREKTSRKNLEDKIMNLEYTYEDEKKSLNEKIENLDSSVRMLELKTRNTTDNLTRMEEKEKEYKSEYQKLHDRYTELLKGYADQVERYKYANHSNVNTLQRGASLKSGVGHIKYGEEFENSQMNKFDSGSNYDLELLEETLTNNMKDDIQPECLGDIMDLEESEKTKETSENIETGSGGRVENSCCKTKDADNGFGKEIDNLIKENTELVETKIALNIVKDDLIKKLDFVNGENDMLKSALEAVHNRESDLKMRISALENEQKDVRQQNEALKHKLENVDEANDSKRFTRMEISILLKERNQYKERLFELEDALKYTEMIRASKQHPELMLDHQKTPRNTTGIKDLFRTLMKSIEESGSSEEVKQKDTSQIKPPDELLDTVSTSKNQKHFVFTENTDRSQLYGWSVPKELSQSSIACQIPTPVASHSIMEAKDSIVCVTKSIDAVAEYKPFLWIIVECPKGNSNSYFLAQFSLYGNEIIPSSSSYLKVLKRPRGIMAVPDLARVIEDRYSFSVDDFPSATQSPTDDLHSSISDYVKVSKVYNTKAKIKQRTNLELQSKTLWINFDDGIVVVYSINANNLFDGRIATLYLPGPVSIMRYFQGRIFMAQLDGCLSVFDLRPTNESWEYHQCLIIEMAHNSPVNALAEHRNSGTVWFGSDQHCYVIGASKLSLKFSFQVNEPHNDEQHISRVECIYGNNNSSFVNQHDLMWVSMSQVGRLFAFDSYTHERKVNIDFRKCLSNIIELVDQTSKFRFSFPIITEDKDRLWLGSNCGFIVTLPKSAIDLSGANTTVNITEDNKSEFAKNIYISCHGFSGTLVNIVSILSTQQTSSMASTPTSNHSLSPTNKPKTDISPTKQQDTNATKSKSTSFIIALGSSYVNLNSSPSKVSIDDYINRNNVLMWRV